MLGKLIQYELKATSRWFVPIYILALLLAPIEHLFILYMKKGVQPAPPFDKFANFLFFLVTSAFVITLIAVGIASCFLIIYRFYKNLVTSEGYLMHTLPVKASQLIWSKAIAAILWNLLSALVICLAIFLLVVGTPGWNSFVALLPRELDYLFQYLRENTSLWKVFVEFFAMLILGSLANIFMLYAAIALGQLVTHHKVLGAFAAYFLLITAVQSFASLLLLPCLGKLQQAVLSTAGPVYLFVNLIFPGLLLFAALITVGFYFITSYIFQNRLNLE